LKNIAGKITKGVLNTTLRFTDWVSEKISKFQNSERGKKIMELDNSTFMSIIGMMFNLVVGILFILVGLFGDVQLHTMFGIFSMCWLGAKWFIDGLVDGFKITKRLLNKDVNA